MASVVGIELDLSGSYAAGAAFRIPKVDQSPVVVSAGNGAVVQIHPREAVLLALLETADQTGWLQAHEAAQRGLDIASFTTPLITALVRSHEEFVHWWHDSDEGWIVRPVVTREVGVSLNATATVTGPHGQPKPDPVQPEPVWTRALRFFRYSQLADDVFDSYRNLFLALEAVLSELVTGGPAGERAWLEHALGELVTAGDLDVSQLAPHGEPDPLQHFLTEQYEARRCAAFHAKSHRDVLTPGSAEDRETVAAALEHLARMVMHLTEKVVKRRRPSGALTYAGFEGFYIGPKVGKLAISLARRSDDGQRGAVVELEVGYFGHDPENRGEHAFAGRARVSDVPATQFDVMHVTAPGTGGLIGSEPLAQEFDILPIDIAGADRVEALIVFALNNLQQPRSRFPR